MQRDSERPDLRLPSWSSRRVLAILLLVLHSATLLAQIPYDFRNSPGVFQFTEATYNVSEGDGMARITVTRLLGARGKMDVDYLVVTDTATTTGTLTFNDFQTSASFMVAVPDNGTEAVVAPVTLVLDNPRPAQGENPTLKPELGAIMSSQLVARDNDLGFVMAVSRTTVSEDGGSVVLTVELKGDPVPDGATFSIDYQINPPGWAGLSAGSDFALPDEDFENVSGTLTFGPNDSQMQISIPILGDNLVEFNEDFLVSLTNPVGEYPAPEDPDAEEGAEAPPPTPVILGGVATTVVTILFNGNPDFPQPAGAVDQTFNPDNDPTTTPPSNQTPGANNTVQSIALQNDGSLIIGGDFTAYNASSRSHVARVLSDGSLDGTFVTGTGANDYVAAVALGKSGGTEGSIYIGGGFNSYNGIPRASLARLNSNGGLDNSFDIGSGADGPIYAIESLSAGGVIVGGDFKSFNGVDRNNIVKLLDSGAVDLNFNPGDGANGPVKSILVDQRPSFMIAQTNRNGMTNAPFVPNTSSTNFLTGAISGQVTIRYNFSWFPDNMRVYYGTNLIFETGLVSNAILVTNMVGQTTEVVTNFFDSVVTIDYGPGEFSDLTIFINEGRTNTTEIDDWLFVATVQPSQTLKVLVGGEFETFDGMSRGGITRLNSDGTQDVSFNPGLGADGSIESIGLLPNGNVVVGGRFNSFDGVNSPNLASLDPNGGFLEDFSIGDGPNGEVSTIEVQRDGNILIGGAFTFFNQTRRQNMARLFPNGLLDTSFLDTSYNQFAGITDPQGLRPFGFINDMTVQPDGDVLIAGRFQKLGGGLTRVDSKPRFNLARLVGGQTPGPGNLGFVLDEYGVDENGGVVGITLERVNGNLGQVNVAYATRESVALEGIDYEGADDLAIWGSQGDMLSDGTIDLPPVPIAIIDEAPPLIEGNESFNIDLSNPASSLLLGGEFIPVGVALGNISQAIVNIVDNDFNVGSFSFSQEGYFVNERTGEAVITVNRIGGATGIVAVSYATGEGTAEVGSDYLESEDFLVFESGETSKTFTVRILDNSIIEDDETIVLALFGASGGATLGEFPTATLTIVDDDFLAGRINFVESEFSVSESGSFAEVSFRRSGGSAGVVSVDYRTSNGTATVPQDYLQTSGRLSWDDSDTSTKTIQVPINPDGIVEGDETFTITLSNPSVPGALGTVTSANVTILDDDFYGDLSFSVATTLVNENASAALIKVIRRNGSSQSVSLDYSTEADTAMPGVDFEEVSGTLNFGVGVLSQSILVPIIDNSEKDGQKKFAVVLGNVVNGTLVEPMKLDILITDDESVNQPPGSLDTEFNTGTGPNGPVNTLVVQADGKILFGGDFLEYNGQLRAGIARLNADATLDAGFNNKAGVNGSIRIISQQPDGRLVLGGNFSTLNGRPFNNIGRLSIDGIIDNAFNPGPGADSTILTMASSIVENDNKIWIGGTFNSYGGFDRGSFARVNNDATLDRDYGSGIGANGPVFVILLLRDGKTLVGGNFTAINGVNRNSLARLNQDGTVDTTFDAGLGAAGSIRTLGLLSDDRILIGGLFSSVSGVALNNVALLNSDGSLDSSFNAGVGLDGGVFASAIQTDDKILLGGDFTSYNGISRNRVLRLNENGSLDSSINFGSGANGVVSVIKIQADQRILLGGGFTEYDGVAVRHLARIYGGAVSGAGTLEFSEAVVRVNESAGEALVQVVRKGGLFGSVSVQYSSQGGTATADVDYQDVSGSLTFGDGVSTRTFSIPLIDDAIVEEIETINVSLSNPQGGVQLGRQPVAQVEIVSNDTSFNFSQPTFTVNEGVSGGRATITVIRNGGNEVESTVTYSTSAGTATAGSDYQNVSGTLTFGIGVSTRSFSIPIVNDTTVEGNETVAISVVSSENGVAGIVQATLTILDNDFAPGFLGFTGSVNVGESSGAVVLNVSRTSGQTGNVTVQYAVTGGTATLNEDYVVQAGILNFGDGETSKTIVVTILDDVRVEGNETISLTLSNPTGGALISSSTGTITIVDDDLGPGSLDLSFNLGAGANGSVFSIDQTDDGRWIVGGDFTSWSGTAASRVVRLLENGALDPDFSTGNTVNGAVRAVSARNGSALRGTFIGGDFSQALNPYTKVALLNVTGFPDVLNFYELPLLNNNSVFALQALKDGKVLVGGDFSSPSGRIMRLNSSGSLDVSFDPDFGIQTGEVRTIALQPDGQALIGGVFSQIAGVSQNHIARLRTNGLLDRSFLKGGIGVNAGGVVNEIKVGQGGKILVGGNFTSVNNFSRANLARLNSDGTVDNTFVSSPGPNGAIYSIAEQFDGKIYIGGDFTQVNGVPRNRIARLNANGSLDLGFDPGGGANGIVHDIRLQEDGKVIIAGAFLTVNGFNQRGLARLNGDPGLPRPRIILESMKVLPNGSIAFEFSAKAGSRYRIEATSDLGNPNWAIVGNVTAFSSTGTFTDSQVFGVGHKFYRIVFVE